MERPMDILLPRHTLEEGLGSELAKQYRLKRGDGCRYMPVSDGSHYLCSCGAVNALGRACETCGLEPELLDRVFLEQLRREAEVRLEAEAAELAEQARQKQAGEKRLRRKKTVRMIVAVAGAVAFLALAAVAFWGITRFAIPAGHYRDGLAALEKKDYQKAHRCFVLAGDYKDAEGYLARFYTPRLTARSTVGDFTALVEYEYDENGRLLKTTERQMTADFKGKLVDIQAPVVYRRSYDEKGNGLLAEDWYGRIQSTYNAQGDPVIEETYRPDGQHQRSRYYSYTYDEMGRKTMAAEICSEHISVNYSYEQTVYYTYNDQGLVETQITRINYPAQTDASCITEATWRYNSDGQPVEKIVVVTGDSMEESDHREHTLWTYDEAGRLLTETKTTQFEKDTTRDSVSTTTNTYNRRGDVTASTSTFRFPNDPRRDMATGAENEYNREGKLIKSRQWSEYTDKEMQEYSGFSQTEVYTYDLFGRQVGYEMEHESPQGTNSRRDEYTFGPDGMVRERKRVEKDSDQRVETVTIYNENGLAESQTVVSKEDHSAYEYTYAYFYFPEGWERPAYQLNPYEPGFRY